MTFSKQTAIHSLPDDVFWVFYFFRREKICQVFAYHHAIISDLFQYLEYRQPAPSQYNLIPIGEQTNISRPQFPTDDVFFLLLRAKNHDCCILDITGFAYIPAHQNNLYSLFGMETYPVRGAYQEHGHVGRTSTRQASFYLLQMESTKKLGTLRFKDFWIAPPPSPGMSPWSIAFPFANIETLTADETGPHDRIPEQTLSQPVSRFTRAHYPRGHLHLNEPHRRPGPSTLPYTYYITRVTVAVSERTPPRLLPHPSISPVSSYPETRPFQYGHIERFIVPHTQRISHLIMESIHPLAADMKMRRLSSSATHLSIYGGVPRVKSKSELLALQFIWDHATDVETLLGAVERRSRLDILPSPKEVYLFNIPFVQILSCSRTM
ncbi:uncharacterized protein BT62DRAFT_1011138 [Guyanagaster necrorhizus]|uniref:Uncharacterized protein n=1 Tax=Guyanagaster necrorhizus TaxID=856835 RepID=A0A9P8ANK0_9AGAR|nr:uncharacterized protein BT62DRAFT_1011138 [Guyanagaster necrorhizus MCA 3950]KAG7441831.1 hypothetical protein BT62DRAFT_1011138 [Guyanagaster necrorhizus MCA 3950]